MEYTFTTKFKGGANAGGVLIAIYEMGEGLLILCLDDIHEPVSIVCIIVLSYGEVVSLIHFYKCGFADKLNDVCETYIIEI